MGLGGSGPEDGSLSESLGWGLVHLDPGPFQGLAPLSLGGLAWLQPSGVG